MMAELFMLIPIGAFFFFIGLRLLRKEQITLIHDYHYQKVSEKDKKPYTALMGKACIVMGTGMILTGLVDFFTKTSYGWILFTAFFICGLIMMVAAQFKYNGGLF